MSSQPRPVPKYKFKLQSGRVIGPFEFHEVRRFVQSNLLKGDEKVKVYPEKKWMAFGESEELVGLLFEETGVNLVPGAERNMPRIVKDDQSEVEPTVPMRSSDPMANESATKTTPLQTHGNTKNITDLDVSPQKAQNEFAEDLEATQMRTVVRVAPAEDADEEKTMMREAAVEKPDPPLALKGGPNDLAPSEKEPDPLTSFLENPGLHQEKTVMISSSKSSPFNLFKGSAANAAKGKKKFTLLVLFFLLLYIEDENFTQYFGSIPTAPAEAPLATKTQRVPQEFVLVRPRLPVDSPKGADPEKSEKLYDKALKEYHKDNDQAYRRAAELYLESLSYNRRNSKALAGLASCYLNLFDSSKKDEEFFQVIQNLLVRSRVTSPDLAEVVQTEVEYLIFIKNYKAAIKRIEDYQKIYRKNFSREMFYYLALAFLENGEPAMAMRFWQEYPASEIKSPRIHYLLGRILEAQGKTRDATGYYFKISERNPDHLKSKLRMITMINADISAEERAGLLVFLKAHYRLLNNDEKAQVQFQVGSDLYGNRNFKSAVEYLKIAVKLDPSSRRFLLFYYTVQSQIGRTEPKLQATAEMYVQLIEAERLDADNQTERAIATFIKARSLNPASAIPAFRLGDLFLRNKDFQAAIRYYRKAFEIDPTDLEVLSKYAKALVQGYEWEEATKAIDQLKKSSIGKGFAERLNGDLYFQQERYRDAFEAYRSASIQDLPSYDLYIQLARTAIQLDDADRPPFYFSVARRYDPTRIDPILEHALFIARKDSWEKAVAFLAEETKDPLFKNRPEYFATLGEIYHRAGNEAAATENLDKAIQADGVNPTAYRIRAAILQAKDPTLDPKYLEKVINAWQEVLSRSRFDPKPYIEMANAYVKLSRFDGALESLSKLSALYPRYPLLHLHKGRLLSLMGNRKGAVKEFREEVRANPNSLEAMTTLGGELTEAGENVEAIAVLQKAMNLYPLSAKAKEEAGWAQYKAKNISTAMALLQAATQLDKGSPSAYRKLGLIYKETGDLLNMKSFFQKYLDLAPDAPDRETIEGYMQQSGASENAS